MVGTKRVALFASRMSNERSAGKLRSRKRVIRTLKFFAPCVGWVLTPTGPERGLSGPQQAPNVIRIGLLYRRCDPSNVAADWNVRAPVVGLVQLGKWVPIGILSPFIFNLITLLLGDVTTQE